jgi:sec-independent protein translocase protein TatA
MHSSVLLFLNIGSSEMVLIVFVALLLFGGEKLPEIARGLGKGIRDFKDASEGIKREINDQINSYEEKKTDKALTQAAESYKAPDAEVATEEKPAGSTFKPVENTLPASDSHFNVAEPTTESGVTHEVAAVAEPHTHTGAAYVDNATPEIK